VLLIFMQLGFFGAVEATATLLHDQLDFDLMLVSQEYSHLNQPGTIARSQLTRALGVEAVTRAVPVYTGFHLWRSRDSRRLRRQILIVGVHCGDPVFTLPELQDALPRLQSLNTALTDRLCRRLLGHMGPDGERTELGQVHIQIVGQFTLGAGFGADGVVVVSDQTFGRICHGHPPTAVSLGLLKLKPGTDPEAVASELRRKLAANVQVLTRAEVGACDRHYWVHTNSVGIIFGVGVGVAVVAGMVFLYQVIASDFRAHTAEYATLKAIGYPRGYLSWVILQQALILAGLGFAAGLPASLALYDLTRRLIVIPIWMNLSRVFFVLFLTAGMCCASALLCSRKIHAADPANLF